MDDLIRLFNTERFSLYQFYDLPWSETRFDRMEHLYQDWTARLQDLNFDLLDEQGRIDYLLLRNQIARETTRLKMSRHQLSEMADLLSFRGPIQDLELARFKMKPVDAPAAATAIAAIPDQIKKLRERIEQGRKAKNEKSKDTNAPPASSHSSDQEPAAANKTEPKKDTPAPLSVTPLVAKNAAEAVGEIRGTLSHWFSFYDGYQPDFSWWLKKPYEDAAKSLEDYDKFLREEIAGLKGKPEDPLLGQPIGAEALAEDISTEMLAYSAQELIAIGERQLAWCESEMKKASAAMGLGDDWKAALAKVKADYVPPGKQDALVADLAHEAIQYVKQHEMVTVPPLCEEIWRLNMISPEGQKTLPFAAYGGQSIQVAYPREEMGNEDKLMAMRGNNRHFTRIVAAHELIPGHHLQSFMSQRQHSYRSTFSTPFFVEGWALYWELRLWDAGYAQTPEDKIGMLFWRMHRAARIIVSLKFHLEEMKPAEMVDFLVQRVGHEKFGATSEVRRFIGGSYSPLYQCGYLIGGLQLNSLHHQLVDSGKMREKQFNDTLLSYGPIPPEFIRDGMLDLPLKRDSKPSWKFDN
jgi:uncharacterized protein (DUF885 family)